MFSLAALQPNTISIPWHLFVDVGRGEQFRRIAAPIFIAIAFSDIVCGAVNGSIICPALHASWMSLINAEDNTMNSFHRARWATDKMTLRYLRYLTLVRRTRVFAPTKRQCRSEARIFQLPGRKKTSLEKEMAVSVQARPDIARWQGKAVVMQAKRVRRESPRAPW